MSVLMTDRTDVVGADVGGADVGARDFKSGHVWQIIRFPDIKETVDRRSN